MIGKAQHLVSARRRDDHVHVRGLARELGAHARGALDERSIRLDRRALARCVSDDPSSIVAVVCESPILPRSTGVDPVTVFVVPAGESAPVPRAPFALVLADGGMRLGVTDRRGALFEPAAPRGSVQLTVPAPLSR